MPETTTLGVVAFRRITQLGTHYRLHLELLGRRPNPGDATSTSRHERNGGQECFKRYVCDRPQPVGLQAEADTIHEPATSSTGDGSWYQRAHDLAAEWFGSITIGSVFGGVQGPKEKAI